MSKYYAILEKIVKDIQNEKNRYGQEKLDIWGGQFAEAQLETDLQTNNGRVIQARS